MARLKKAKLYNIVLVPSRLSASRWNKQEVLAYGLYKAFVLILGIKYLAGFFI